MSPLRREAQDEKRGRGRPRDSRIDDAIIAAVYEVVGEVGVRATTMTELACRAAIGKPTLYTRWRSVCPMVLAALAGLQSPVDEVSDLSPRAGIAAALADDRAFLIEGPQSRFLRALLFASAYQSDVALALDTCVLGPRRARLGALVASAAPGAAEDDTRVSAAVDMLCGSVIRGMLRGCGEKREGYDDAFLIDLVMYGIATPSG